MKNKLGKAKTPRVLAGFEVQQNGNAIAVVDRDGSVYTGCQPASNLDSTIKSATLFARK